MIEIIIIGKNPSSYAAVRVNPADGQSFQDAEKHPAGM